MLSKKNDPGELALYKNRGRGSAKPQRDISIDRIHLDPDNPRLSEEDQGSTQSELIEILYNEFDLDELAYSMSENGYFDEEPLVVVPRSLPKEFSNKTYDQIKKSKKLLENFQKLIESEKTDFIAVEGNRRLATAKILVDSDLRKKMDIKNWAILEKDCENDWRVLPAIIYPSRSEVLPYLGVRHIAGIRKWDSFAKARYIADLVDKGLKLHQIKEQVGDRTNSTLKTFICFKLIKQVEDEFGDYDTSSAKNLFSYLQLAFGEGAVKEHLGMPKQREKIDIESPVNNKKNLKKLKQLFTWLFGEGKKISPIITDSRDITNKLAPILRDKRAIEVLEDTGNLDYAYDISEGEKESLQRKFSKVLTTLEQASAVLPRSKYEGMKSDLAKIQDVIERILKNLR